MDSPLLAIASALGIVALAAAGLASLRGLQRRAQARVLQRQQQRHQERLAAIGAMAAGVLRDIGNPIAAIDGYARAMVDAQRRGELPPPPGPHCDPARIVNEAERLAAITHEISGLAMLPGSAFALVSINDIVQQAIALLRYDARFAGVQVRVALDPQLPALPGVADRLLLLVTQLLGDALDAGARCVDAATRCIPGGIEIAVSADGARRPAEPALAEAVAHEHGGLIEINWNPQTGTRTRVTLKDTRLN